MALAFILAALTLSGTVQVWHVILISIGVGVFNAFDAPARLAFVFDLVDREDLSNAIALNAMLMNGARVIGPAFGGFILATLGAGWCFFFNGLSFLSVIVALLVMRVDYSNMTHRELEHPFRQLLDGIRYVFRHVEIFAPASTLIALQRVRSRLHCGVAGLCRSRSAARRSRLRHAQRGNRVGCRGGSTVDGALRRISFARKNFSGGDTSIPDHVILLCAQFKFL